MRRNIYISGVLCLFQSQEVEITFRSLFCCDDNANNKFNILVVL